MNITAIIHGAFIYYFFVKGVIHVADRPLHFTVRADYTFCVAGISSFDSYSIRESTYRKVECAAYESTGYFRQCSAAAFCSVNHYLSLLQAHRVLVVKWLRVIPNLCQFGVKPYRQYKSVYLKPQLSTVRGILQQNSSPAAHGLIRLRQ